MSQMEALVLSMRRTSEAIVDMNKEGTSNKAALLQETKSFNKLSDEQKLAQWAPLVKHYQKEINSLTRRVKYAETAFTTVHSRLESHVATEKSKPSSVAEPSTPSNTKDSSLRRKVMKLELANKELLGEFKDLKNQEVTVQNLEAKNAELQAKITEVETERDTHTAAAVDAQVSALYVAFREQEALMRARLDEAKAENAKLLNNAAQTQAMTTPMSSSNDEGFNAERIILQEKLERTQEAVIKLQQSNALLQEKLENAMKTPVDESKNASMLQTMSELKSSVAVLTENISKKDSELQQLKLEAHSESSKLSAEILDVRTALLAAQNMNRELNAAISTLPTLEEHEHMKTQLALFQDIDSADSSQTLVESSEAMLVRKIRALETRNSDLATQVTEHADETARLTKLLNEKSKEILEAKHTVTLLEDDLIAMRHNSQTSSLSTKPRPIQATPACSPAASLNSLDTGEDEESGNSMLAIIVRQRDRLTVRLRELESQLSQTKLQLADSMRRWDTLSAENVAMYEKLQYVTRTSSNAMEQGRAAKKQVSNDAIDSKYAQLYHTSVNPFKEFKKKHRSEMEAKLSTAERITLGLGRFICSKKGTRMFVFFYSVCLHLLVFFTIWEHTLFEHCSGEGSI